MIALSRPIRIVAYGSLLVSAAGMDAAQETAPTAVSFSPVQTHGAACEANGQVKFDDVFRHVVLGSWLEDVSPYHAKCKCTRVGLDKQSFFGEESSNLNNPTETIDCETECEVCYQNATICGRLSSSERRTILAARQVNATGMIRNKQNDLPQSPFQRFDDVHTCFDYTRGTYSGNKVCLGEMYLLDGLVLESPTDLELGCDISYDSQSCSNCAARMTALGNVCYTADCTRFETGATIDTCAGKGMDGAFGVLEWMGGKQPSLNKDNFSIGTCPMPSVQSLDPNVMAGENSTSGAETGVSIGFILAIAFAWVMA